jgi:ribosome biogenesis GTPase
MHKLNTFSARVSSAGRGFYGLFTESGEATAQLAGSFRHDARSAAELPVVGDYVSLDESGLICGVLPRRTKFSRRAAGTRDEEQVLAANVDVAFLVCGLDRDFNVRRLERYLVLAHESGADPVVVLNKADLQTGAALDACIARARSVAAGAPVVTCSTMAAGGVDALRSLLEPGLTAVLLGSSGAGKSSIANALLGDSHLRTQPVRESDSRGRHTTTHRELIRLANGAWLIDTPGLREIQLWASEESVVEVFADLAEVAARCRFRDCTHTREPGCAVLAAVESGELDPGRVGSSQKLSGEARALRKAELKRIARAVKAFYKLKGQKGA